MPLPRYSKIFQDVPRCSKAPTRGVGRCSKIHWSNRVAMALAVMPCQRARTRSYRVRMGTVSKDGCLSGCWPLLLKAIKTAQIPRLDFDKSERQMQNTRQSACVQYTWITAIYIPLPTKPFIFKGLNHKPRVLQNDLENLGFLLKTSGFHQIGQNTVFYRYLSSLASGTEAQVLQIKLRGSSMEVQGTPSDIFIWKLNP